jgi:hypothetical protein
VDLRSDQRRDRGPGEFFGSLSDAVVAFAKAEFKLIAKQDDGATLRAHLERVYQNTGFKPQQLAEAPELPEDGILVWTYFCELSAERSGNGMGPNPISSRDIEAWCRLNGIQLEVWEIGLIKRLDREFLSREDDK